LDFVGKVKLSGTSTSNQTVVSDEGLDGVDTVIDGALNVVEEGDGGASKDDGGHFVLLKVSAEDSAPGGGDFFEGDLVSESHLVGSRAFKFDNGGGADSSADSLELPLGHNLNSHHVVLLEEVNGKFGHTALANNTGYASLSKFLDETFEFVLLTGGVVEEIVGGLEQNGTLSFTLLHFNVGIEYSNLGVLNVLDGSFGSLGHNDTLNNSGVVSATTENLLDSDVVNVEFLHIVGHGKDSSLSNKFGEEVLETVLLGGNNGLDATNKFGLVSGVLELVAGEAFEQFKCFLGSLIVTNHDL
jgi:hypothetical protein